MSRTRPTRSAPVRSARLLPRSLAGSVAVHSAVLGAGLLLGALAPGGSPRAGRSFTAEFAVVLPPEPEPREFLEPIPETVLSEPELVHTEVWGEPEASLDPRDEPVPPPRPRAADWLAERPLALGTLAPALASASEPSPPPTSPAEPAVAALQLPALEPVVQSSPPPTYPRLARRAGEQGSVLCRLHLDEQGLVRAVEVVESSGFSRLDEAAREALVRWTFVPRHEGGRPVSTSLLHRVTFVLDAGRS